MLILTYENCLNWSWGLTVTKLLKKAGINFIRRQREQRLHKEETEAFDFVLVQNIDSLKRIEDLSKCIVRIGGFLVDKKNLATRYDDYISSVDYIIATNQKLALIGRNTNPNCVMIPNGVDLEIFTPDPNRVFDNKLNVGFVGNITGIAKRYKGWHLLAYAISVMFMEINKFIPTLYNQKQLPHEQMPEYYKSIDCLVLASVDEGCSNTITEALACGVPVICTKVGYHGELLTDGVNCLFTKRDKYSIIENLRKLVNNPELRETLSKNGRKFAEEYQDINIIANEYKKVFEEAFNG